MTAEEFLILVVGFGIVASLMAVGYHVFEALGSWLKNKKQAKKNTIVCLNCRERREPDKVFPLYCVQCRSYGLKYRTIVNLDEFWKEAGLHQNENEK